MEAQRLAELVGLLGNCIKKEEIFFLFKARQALTKILADGTVSKDSICDDTERARLNDASA